jgi:hypothetical protein
MSLEWEELNGKLGIASLWSWVSNPESFGCEAASLTYIEIFGDSFLELEFQMMFV